MENIEGHGSAWRGAAFCLLLLFYFFLFLRWVCIFVRSYLLILLEILLDIIHDFVLIVSNFL